MYIESNTENTDKIFLKDFTAYDANLMKIIKK